jgi:hypothetical protein
MWMSHQDVFGGTEENYENAIHHNSTEYEVGSLSAWFAYFDLKFE